MMIYQRIIGAAVALIILGYLISGADKPVMELEAARHALKRAIVAKAPELSSWTYVRAERALRAAEQELDAQNARWFWERNYSRTIEFLISATNDGQQAAEDAIAMKPFH